LGETHRKTNASLAREQVLCETEREKGVKDDQEKLQRKTVFASSLNSTIQE
jgi:hypothetical protein